MRRMINNITYEFPDFFYSWKFKEAKYKLRDLYVRVYVDYKQETPFVLVKIPKSPVYQYLITGNKRVYEDYHDFVRNEINENDRHSTKNFTLLINELKEKGYDKTTPIMISRRLGELEIVDGQHRAAYLYTLNPEMEVFVLEEV